MANELMSVEGQLVGMPLAGPESFSQQQLDYLKQALGVDETVLWEETQTAGSVTLSESANNFKLVEIFYRINDGVYNSVKVMPIGGEQKIAFSTGANWRGVQFIAKFTTYTLNGTALGPSTAKSAMAYGGDGSSPGTVSVQFEGNAFYLIKVVGIHRIAGGN